MTPPFPFVPNHGAGDAPAFINSGSATGGLSVNVSTWGLKSGDVLLWVAAGDADDTIFLPTGFTSLDAPGVTYDNGEGPATGRARTAYKVSDGTETVISNSWGGMHTQKCIAVAAYRGVAINTANDAYATTTDSTTHDSGGISCVENGFAVAMFASFRHTNTIGAWTPDGDTAERADDNDSTVVGVFIADEQVTSTGTSATQTHTNGGSITVRRGSIPLDPT